jgi:hypothetical protein
MIWFHSQCARDDGHTFPCRGVPFFLGKQVRMCPIGRCNDFIASSKDHDGCEEESADPLLPIRNARPLVRRLLRIGNIGISLGVSACVCWSHRDLVKNPCVALPRFDSRGVWGRTKKGKSCVVLIHENDHELMMKEAYTMQKANVLEGHARGMCINRALGPGGCPLPRISFSRKNWDLIFQGGKARMQAP